MARRKKYFVVFGPAGLNISDIFGLGSWDRLGVKNQEDKANHFRLNPFGYVDGIMIFYWTVLNIIFERNCLKSYTIKCLVMI